MRTQHALERARAAPLRLMKREANVFVDDDNRALERHFADLVLRGGNPACALLARETEAGKTCSGRSAAGCRNPRPAPKSTRGQLVTSR
jgi:hypothetical protein